MGTDAAHEPSRARRGGFEAKPGSTLGQYEIIRPLGSGSTSEVVLARDTRLGRLVAIKLLCRCTGELAQRFLTEARATAQLSHENIVVVHDLGEHEGMPFLVLEYLKGKTLRQWLNEHKARASEERSPAALVSPGRAVELMIPVARALACAHEHGVVHRDLKPPNIVLTDAGTIKVLDFGIAKLLGGPTLPGDEGCLDEETPDADALLLTQTGAMMGTLPYMSPEQWGADAVDERSDLWAVGILLSEILLGRHLLGPLTLPALRSVRHLDVPMPSLRELCPELGKLGSIVDRCLIKRKEDRLGSARELCAELEAAGRASLRRASSSGRASFADEDEAPYAGLSAFQQADADRFFGRARAVTEAVNRLAEQPLLAVVGPSGAGKSSFVRAGLIPALERTGEAWETFVVRPGRHPLTALAELLLQLRRAFLGPGARADESAAGPPSLVPADRDGLREKLRAEPGLLGARLRLRARRKLERVLFFVDQLEELYTLAAEDERAAFFACLSGVADDTGSPLRVVVAIRSDFLERMAESHAALTGLGRGLMLLAPLGREGLRDALVRPLDALGYRFEHSPLVEEMLDALEQTNGALPLLQFTASKLWEHRDRGGRLLTEASYRRMGGVAGTLAGHADETLRAMSPGERKLCRALLLCLITPDRTRALCTQRELGERVGAGEETFRVLGRLVDARLLSVESAGEADATVELVHESLITAWPTLALWIAGNQEDAAFRARLGHAAREWRAHARAEDLLWHGQAVDEARRFRARCSTELSPDEQEYLSAVFGLAERALRQRRGILAGSFTLLVVVAAGMSYLALEARGEAARARDATRLFVAREQQDNPATVLGLLREVEGTRTPRGWSELAKYALDTRDARTVVLGEAAMVTPAAWSPDGKRIAAASWDNAVRVWSVDDRSAPLVLEGHGSTVRAIAWSPDGARIASASNDRTVRVWDAVSRGDPVVLRGHTGLCTSVAVSPDGTRVASASNDGTVRVWSASGAGSPVVLSGHSDIVRAAVFVPDGTRVVSASNDRTVRVWDADGRGVPVVLRGHTAPVTAVAVSPDGTRIASASNDRTVRVWSASGAGSPVVLSGHAGEVVSLSWSPDGTRIASASNDKTVRVWSASGAGSPVVLSGHSDPVAWVAWSPDGTRIASASSDRTVRVWSAAEPGEPLILLGHTSGVGAVSWSPDGTRIASVSQDTTARIWRDLAPVEPDDPRLWTAAARCLPVAERQRLLGLSETLSRAQYERCLRRVEQASRLR